jgi:hypothetical protein
MTLPSTIRTAVSQAAITKVTRLFNGSVGDVLNELLQNARRAGASRVDIETLDLAGHPTLSVRDDGQGIDDPSVLVTLGQSGWDVETARREDPAGMGVFSLAGHRVEIRSFSPVAQSGWRVVIPEDAWETSAVLAVESFPIEAGTDVLIDLPEQWESALPARARDSARHYPVPVYLGGTPLDQSDFLVDADYVEVIDGIRIGVFRDTSWTGARGPQVNFHGIRVACELPSVCEVDRVFAWRTRIDIADAPQLQLVLPARKELVQNDALIALATAAERAIYHAILAAGSHRLGFQEWQRARELGVCLPIATPGLEPWSPKNVHDRERTDPIFAEPAMVRIPSFEPHLELCLARTLASHSDAIAGPLARENPAFEGYPWYDRLSRISDLAFRVEQDSQVFRIRESEALSEGGESGPVKSIVLELAVDSDDGFSASREQIEIPADLIIDYQGFYSGVDDVLLFWNPSAAIDPADAAHLLELGCFSFDEDRHSGNYETQLHEFRIAAQHLATSLLISEDEAALERIRTTLRHELCWLIPEGRSVSITVSRTDIALAFLSQDV